MNNPHDSLRPQSLRPLSRSVTICGTCLASPYFAFAAVAITLLLTVCSLQNGLFADDYFHRAVLQGSKRFGELLPGPQGMFRFADGDPAHTRAWMDIGWLPWWTDVDIKAEFFQFIPTQTHIVDYWLWPDRPELMHAHSLVWLALLVFLAAQFYRRMLGATWMAGMAALLFAIEDGHALPVGWICNRNCLIAASFGIGCLIAHDVWRRDRKTWAFWLALVLFGASLCSKEEGIATCAYLFAYALWIDEATLGKRFITLVPYGLLLIVWRLVRDSLGFGVAHVGYYVDPFTDAGQFFTGLFQRYPVLLLGQWAGLSELWVVLRSTMWWVAVSYITLLGLLFWPILKRDRTARFFATGMLLAVIPVCATFPMDRLLMFTGLGAFGLLVCFWNAVLLSIKLKQGTRCWRYVAVPVAWLLLFFHVIAAPVLLFVRASVPWGPSEFTHAMFPTSQFDPTIEQQDLIVVNPPVAWLVGYCLFHYEHEQMPAPRAVRALAPGIRAVSVRRKDDQTLEVSPQSGFVKFPDSILRSEAYPLKVGEQVALPGMKVTVLSVKYGRPQTVEFRFDRPLESAALRWVQFQDGEFVPWTPPAVGEEVTLPGLGWPLAH